MLVLVTGAAGFIGSHVVDRLQVHGITVRVFDLTRPRQDGVEYQQGSILDMETLRIAMNGVDAVYHLAAVADVGEVVKDPSYAEEINVRGTANVLEAMRRAGLSRIIYGGTTWVYSNAHADAVDESTPLGMPDHLYTATKLTGEYYCHAYDTLYGFEPTILRFGIPFGPRARPAAVIPIFVKRALDGETITIAGDGLQFRQFIYVEDLAEGCVMALQSVGKHKIYNLDGARQVTIREIAETVQRIVGDVKIEFGPARPGDFSGKRVSSDLALKELGWEPKFEFEEGVRRYVDWYKAAAQETEDRWSAVDQMLRP